MYEMSGSSVTAVLFTDL